MARDGVVGGDGLAVVQLGEVRERTQGDSATLICPGVTVSSPPENASWTLPPMTGVGTQNLLSAREQWAVSPL